MAAVEKLIPTENEEQRALVKWIRAHPILNQFVIKLNNEGKRTEFQGYHLKLMGMQPGASDLIIPYPAHNYHGLWLEVKRNKHYAPSEKTRASWIAEEKFVYLMRSVGYAAEFCYGCEDGKRIIESYLAGTLFHPDEPLVA